jgi:hypothetical protein
MAAHDATLERSTLQTDSSQPIPFPPYTYVPGGPWPHPTRSPQGHSFGHTPPGLDEIDPTQTARSTQFIRGAELFNAGYYWEAHEAWEALWHTHGRRGPTADVLKGLIKLAAAGVKVREGREKGVGTHATRAAASFVAARARVGRYHLGLDLDQWIDRACGIAENPPPDPGTRDAAVTRVFGFQVEVSGRSLEVVDDA